MPWSGWLVARLLYFMINFSRSSITFQFNAVAVARVWSCVVAVLRAFCCRILFSYLYIERTNTYICVSIVICFVLPTLLARARLHFCVSFSFSLSLCRFLSFNLNLLAVVSTANDLKMIWFSVKRQHSSSNSFWYFQFRL